MKEAARISIFWTVFILSFFLNFFFMVKNQFEKSTHFQKKSESTRDVIG